MKTRTSLRFLLPYLFYFLAPRRHARLQRFDRLLQIRRSQHVGRRRNAREIDALARRQRDAIRQALASVRQNGDEPVQFSQKVGTKKFALLARQLAPAGLVRQSGNENRREKILDGTQDAVTVSRLQNTKIDFLEIKK